MSPDTLETWPIPPLPEINWGEMDHLIVRHGVTVERKKGSHHPHYAAIIYPIDYGFIPDTCGEDGEPIDIFIGTAPRAGLLGAARTRDRRKGDTEIKLLWNCTPAEVYLVYGFLNFSPMHMTASLSLRAPLSELWENSAQ